MEVDCRDPVAQAKCIGKTEAIIGFVQRNLGFAAVVFIFDVPGKGLKLDTGAGSIIVDYDLKNIVKEES